MLVTQMMRTRNARKLMQEKADMVSNQLVTQLYEIPEINKNKNLYSRIEKYRILDENTFKEISLPASIDDVRLEQYSAILDSMLCTFYENRTNEYFITSDNPVVIYRTSTQELGLGKAGIGHLDCMIAYPINSILTAVLVHKDSLYGLALSEFESRKLPIVQVEIVRTLNNLQLLQASRQVYSKKPINMKWI
jgi:hypothetical protein